MIVLAYVILGIVGLAIAGLLGLLVWQERAFCAFFLIVFVLPTCLIMWALTTVGAV